MKSLFLVKNIEGENFIKLMNYLFERTSYFSLCKTKWNTPTQTKILEELEPYLVKQIDTNYWLYCDLGNDLYNIHIYTVNEETKKIISNSYKSLFSKDKYGNVAELPEDLCFFENEKLVLGTISTSGSAYMFETPGISMEYMEALGEWEEVDFESVKGKWINLDVSNDKKFERIILKVPCDIIEEDKGMKCISSNRNIEGRKFVKLMKYLFKKTDYFSLHRMKCSSVLQTKILERLEPYLLKKIDTTHWFHYYVPTCNLLNIQIYEANKKTKKIILNFYKNLFAHNKDGNIVNVPEDLCFFKNEKLVLGTVSHDRIASVFETVDISMEYIKTLGEWENAIFECEKEEWINLNMSNNKKFERIIEEEAIYE